MISLSEIPFGNTEMTCAENSAVAVFCPGNGTSYRLVLTKVEEPLVSLLGCNTETYMVSYYTGTGYRTWFFGAGGIAHTSYVEEKLDIRGDGLLSVTAAINALIPSYSTEYGEKCFDAIRKD
jgi:hypothetical protein